MPTTVIYVSRLGSSTAVNKFTGQTVSKKKRTKKYVSNFPRKSAQRATFPKNFPTPWRRPDAPTTGGGHDGTLPASRLASPLSVPAAGGFWSVRCQSWRGPPFSSLPHHFFPSSSSFFSSGTYYTHIFLCLVFFPLFSPKKVDGKIGKAATDFWFSQTRIFFIVLRPLFFRPLQKNTRKHFEVRLHLVSLFVLRGQCKFLHQQPPSWQKSHSLSQFNLLVIASNQTRNQEGEE